MLSSLSLTTALWGRHYSSKQNLRLREVQELSLHFIAQRGRAGVHILGCLSSVSPLSPCLKIWVQICPFLAGPSWCLGTPGDAELAAGGGKTSRIGVSVRELWFRVAPQAGSESRKPAGSLGEDWGRSQSHRSGSCQRCQELSQTSWLVSCTWNSGGSKTGFSQGGSLIMGRAEIIPSRSFLQ